jgi:hypothetical protein
MGIAVLATIGFMTCVGLDTRGKEINYSETAKVFLEIGL